jgi:ATP-dependent Lon protease
MRSLPSISQSGPREGDFRNDGSQKPQPPPEAEGTGGILPLVPLRELIAFPHVVYPIIAGRAKTMKAILTAKSEHVAVVLVAQKDSSLAAPTEADLYTIGTIGILLNIVQLPDGTVNAAIQGKRRARVPRFMLSDDLYRAEIEKVTEAATLEAGREDLVEAVASACDQTPLLSDWSKALATGVPASELADRVASDLQIRLAEKQTLLEMTDPVRRLEKVLEHLRS